MPNVCFFSFREDDRDVVATIKGRAVNTHYSNLNFRVKDLLKRWDTSDQSRIRAAISTAMHGTSRTIVFVGGTTHLSYWVHAEVKMTVANEKPCYAIRLRNTVGPKPRALTDNGITLHEWSEAKLQQLATQ